MTDYSEEIKKQDELNNDIDDELNRIGNTVDFLHEIATNMNRETTYQISLLNKMEDEVDNTDDRIKRSNKQIETIKKMIVVVFYYKNISNKYGSIICTLKKSRLFNL